MGWPCRQGDSCRLVAPIDHARITRLPVEPDVAGPIQGRALARITNVTRAVRDPGKGPVGPGSSGLPAQVVRAMHGGTPGPWAAPHRRPRPAAAAAAVRSS